MVGIMDQDRGGEVQAEENLILGRFLREYNPDIKKNFIKENKILFSEKINIHKNNLKELMPLDIIINPLILEGEAVDRRVDEFIRQRMRREIPQRVTRPLPVPDLGPKRSFSSPTGLRADKMRGYARSLTVNGKAVLFEDYNDIHFMPGGRAYFDSSRVTESLTKGIQGVVDLLDAVDQGEFEPASTFIGTTNINMALIAQRLGFVIIDECRNQDGSINKNSQQFTVVGELRDIRARVEEFKRAGIDQKLAQRNQRLRAKPKLAPAGT